MDPLSIAATAVGLAETAASLSVWLYELVKDIKNIDTKVSELCNEVSRLSGLLESVQKTVRECQDQALTLAHLDHQMWKHIASTLEDCESNLGGLEALLIRIRREYDPEGSGLSRLLKKTNMNIYFTLHKDEIQDYTFKVMRSNCAMQTTLGVVSVSLNLRANISQDTVFEELRILKALVHEALRVSKRQEAISDASSTRQSENLGRLAEAAKQFHITASSTASTNYSEIGGIFTDAKHDYVKTWSNTLATAYESTEEDNLETDSPTARVVSGRDAQFIDPIATTDQPPSGSEDSDVESDFDLDILRNIEEVAFDSFASQNYSKAEQCLRLAVQRSTGDTVEGSNFRQLKIQLALCCCLQDKWDHAISILSSLLKVKSVSNLPVFQLLQAVVIANIAGSQLDDALKTCEIVRRAKRKLFGKESAEYHECLWLIAIIHDKQGDELQAEAIRRSIPPGWAPMDPGILNSPKAYILNNNTLVQAVFSRKTEGSPGSSRRQAQVPDMESESSDGHAKAVPDVPQLLSNESDEPPRNMRTMRREGTIEETDTGKEIFFPEIERLHPIQDRVCDSTYSQVHSPPTLFDGSPFSPTNQHDQYGQGTPNNSRDGLGIRLLPGNHTAMPIRSDSRRGFPVPAPVSNNVNGLARSRSHNLTPDPQSESRAETFKSLKRPIIQIPSQDFEQRPDVVDPSCIRLGTTQTGSYTSHQEARQALPWLNIPDEGSSHSGSSKEHLSPQSPYIDKTVGFRSENDGRYSDLEVVDTSVFNTSPSIERSPRSPATPTTPLTPLSNYAHQLTRLKAPSDLQNTESLRTRWTVRNDIGNIGEPRPLGPSSPAQFLPIFRSTPTPGTCFVGVSAGVNSTSSIALNMGQEETTICQMPEKTKQDAPNQTPTLGVRDFFRKATYSIHSNRPKSPLTDDSRYTVDVAYPRHWPGEYETVDSLGHTSQLLGNRRDLLDEHVSMTRCIESEIARIMRRGQSVNASHSGAIISLRIEGVVYAIPDFLERTMWQSWTHILEKSMLLQHAKVIPKSYAVVQYYLDSGALVPDPDDPFVAPKAVVVLNGDEKLVDCVPYFLQRVSESYVEITESRSDYLAEMAGSKHAQVQFAKLVSDQLLLTVRELRRKVDDSAIQDIIQSCCDQFERSILPDFENNGREWTVEFEMPSGAPGFQHGRLKFSNAEIARCFNRSVTMIEKMLESMVSKHIHADIAVSHILLAGSYSKSKYLRLCLEKKLSELRLSNKGTLKLCYPSESDDICVLGALSHAIGSCTEQR